MKFVGDIIITDPCYIMIKKEKDYRSFPNWWDFYSKSYKYIDKNGKECYYLPNATDYPDVECMSFEDYVKKDLKLDASSLDKKTYFYLKKLYSLSLELISKSKIFDSEKKNFDFAMEKWKAENMDDWERTNYGINADILGIKNYLVSDTGYGDWSCTTLEKRTNKKLGEFCADAGMVGVFLLDEVLKYNPNFDYYTQRPWTTTLIKNFNGDIEIKRNDEDGVYIEGKGNINFYTIQTGL